MHILNREIKKKMIYIGILETGEIGIQNAPIQNGVMEVKMADDSLMYFQLDAVYIIGTYQEWPQHGR